MPANDVLCAYCGDRALYGRLDGAGYPFCGLCVGLATTSVEPESPKHHALRPYLCGVCGKRTSSPYACARESCVVASQN